jgi:hypothetical protein
VYKNTFSSPVNIHGNIQDENTSSLKNEPLTTLRWPHPGIPQNLSTTVGIPHKTNLHTQKGMYQMMIEDQSKYDVTSHPRKGRTKL